MSDQNKTGEQDIIERLRYIAGSPGREYGGFPEQVIQTAKDAIVSLAAEREKTKQAWREHDDVAKALAEFSETIKQLGARNRQLREQLSTTERTLEAAQQRANELSEDLEHYSEVIDKREATLEAAYENHKSDVARLNADYSRELNQKLEQINAQAGTIHELVDVVELLRGVHTWFMQQSPEKYNGCGLWIDVDEFLKEHPRQNCILEVDSPTLPPDKDEYLQCRCVNCNAALSKLSYPLRDGRTR